jgi:hypothetical protein
MVARHDEQLPLVQQRPAFEIISSTDGDGHDDMRRRKEIKFAIPRADLGKLRASFRGPCRPVAYNEPVSTVRSVYFDDPALSACRANLDGIGRRQKLRVRWYDALLPMRDFFVEIKWRNNILTGKHRFQMRSTSPLAELSYREIHATIATSVPESIAPYVLGASEPVVMVEFKREHFCAKYSGIRLTIDYDLACYDQLSKQCLSTSFRKSLGDLVVVEAKMPVGREHELKDVIGPFTRRMTKCSKYVLGCRSLGLASPIS